MNRTLIFILLYVTPTVLLSQYTETEPNNTRESATVLSLDDSATVQAGFSPAADVDYFVMEWHKDAMYYLTSIENDGGVSPNMELFLEDSPVNLLTTDIGGRNGNNNFRLSGYVPNTSGTYYARVYDINTAQGAYKVRFAGGRTGPQLLVHEPDNTINFAFSSAYLNADDTVYGALYPANDMDYYKISAAAGQQYEIITCPVLDLDVRDTDTYLMLFDAAGNLISENDDIGTVETPSGTVNSTFSKMVGYFPGSGDYYIAVRSYYNTNYNQTISETNPPTGEYGLRFSADDTGILFQRHPHVELPTTESILIQWTTTTEQSTHVKWGISPACENEALNPDQTREHLVKISGLQPSTKYYYRVFAGSEDSTLTEFFHTAKPPSEKNVKFFVISDSSPYSGFGSTPEQLQVAARIQEVEYDFGLHAGDVNQHHGEEYDLVFYQPYRDILANAPIFPCIGNHDTVFDNTKTYQNSFNLPYNNPDSTERYYSFNYGHAHFISLDTNLPYYPGSAQYEWLLQDLTSDMRSETLWTFVYFHHPPWSEGWPGYPGEPNVRTHLVPLFEQYHVDMIFNGHTHDYERGLLNGVYYIITGGGGAPLEEGIQAYDYEHVEVWVNQHHFTYIQLEDKTLTLKAINKDGESIDFFSIDKNTSEIDQESGRHPDRFYLYKNYPNPFNGSTSIRFDIEQATEVNLKIFDLNGRLIRSLVSEYLAAGKHQITWNGKNDAGHEIASGIYIYTIETPRFTQSRKAVLLK